MLLHFSLSFAIVHKRNKSHVLLRASIASQRRYQKAIADAVKSVFEVYICYYDRPTVL